MSEVDHQSASASVRSAQSNNAPARVLLVTSDREACGIREYGFQLQKSLDPNQVMMPEYPHTSPEGFFDDLCKAQQAGDLGWQPEVVHLNHHAALHSGWKPEHLRALKALGLGVVVTQHDTFESWELMQERGMFDARGADYLFVHEQVTGLAASTGAGCTVVVLRQPVLEVEVGRWPKKLQNWKACLGLFGFDFPWKNFRLAIEAARGAGWAVRLYSNNLTIARAEELHQLHPEGLTIETGYREIEEVIRGLAECDATAFLYSTGNSGTSAAIRVGIAAQRPVIAAQGCRQFRDLEPGPAGMNAAMLDWVPPTVDAVAARLRMLWADSAYWLMQQSTVARLAQRDSWKLTAGYYSTCYRELALRKRARMANGAVR